MTDISKLCDIPMHPTISEMVISDALQSRGSVTIPAGWAVYLVERAYVAEEERDKAMKLAKDHQDYADKLLRRSYLALVAMGMIGAALGVLAA